MWNKCSLALLLVLCARLLAAQFPDTSFIHHLVNYNLEAEHNQYLFHNKQTEGDTLLLLKYRSRFLFHTQSDSLFILQYQHNQPYGLSDTALIKSANAHFLNPLNTQHKTWFGALNKDETLVLNSPEYSLFQRVWTSSDTSRTGIPFTLQDSYAHYLKYRDKKPWKAALYSAIIPGTGKLYAGHKGAFLPNFLMHAAMGFQTGESIAKNGIKSAISIVNISVFAFYYASNIYGSSRAVKTKQREYRNQFLIEASEYYDSICDCDLY
jgi:hypothetical protein